MTGPRSFEHIRGALLAALVNVVVAAACGEDQLGPKTGSNSNWLIACTNPGDCAQASSCLCGACSRQCGNDADCADLDGGRCSVGDASAASTQCGKPAASLGLCLPGCEPGTCQVGQSCIDGTCVLADLPQSEFCAAALAATQDDRSVEDQLLTLIQQHRVAGSIACDTGVTVEAAPPLRLDGRLRCAARIRALDHAETGVRGSVDSEGRSGPERFALADYQVSNWWETYNYNTTTAAQVYERLLADSESCSELGNPAYTDVGVGRAGGTVVVTLVSD